MGKTASRERFVRIAEKRVGRALRILRAISPLADRDRYDYDDKDAEKIVSALEAELVELKTRFAEQATKRKTKFTLA